MKQAFFTVAGLLLITAANAQSSQSAAGQVSLMHNGHIITVSDNALSAHLSHGCVVMVLHNGAWITEADYLALNETEFSEPRENLAAVEKEYEEVGTESVDDQRDDEEGAHGEE
jgi:hypothetical protein